MTAAQEAMKMWRDAIERTWSDSFSADHCQWDVLDDWSSFGKFSDKKVPLSSKFHTQKETIPSDLPSHMIQMYSDLLELYTQRELEWHRKEYGDQIICELYNEEFGPFFDVDDVWEGEDAPFSDGRKEKE